jgi:hypothetical protein
MTNFLLRRRGALFAPVICAALAGRSLEAQARGVSASLSSGARIRYTLDIPERDRYVATVAAVSGDSLYLRYGNGDTATPLALGRLARLEVSVGRDRHVGRDAMIGGAVGALGFALVSGIATSSSHPHACPATVLQASCLGPEAHHDIGGAAVRGGFGGILAGAILGVFHRSDHWIDVPLF